VRRAGIEILRDFGCIAGAETFPESRFSFSSCFDIREFASRGRRWRSALSGRVGVGSSLAPRRTTLTADRVELPTFENCGMLFIDARLNGAGPFRLLVDTGSRGLILPLDIATAAGLELRSGRTLLTPVGHVKFQTADVTRLESGGLKLEHVPTAVVDTGDCRAGAKQLCSIRWRDRNRNVEGARPRDGFLPQTIRVARPGTWRTFDLQSVSYDRVCPVVTIDVAGKSLPVLLDTGSGFALIAPNLEAYPLIAPPIKDEGRGGVAIGSKEGFRGESAQLAGDLRFGPLTWHNPPLRRQTSGKIGNLGTRSLATCRLIVDQKARRIFFPGAAFETDWLPATVSDLQVRPGYADSFGDATESNPRPRL